MNTPFFEDFKKEVHLDEDAARTAFNSADIFQFYIAKKLWSIEQLLKNRDQERF